MYISNLISSFASSHLDFFWVEKRRMIPRLFPTLCAFLNSEGGKVIIGISRDKQFQNLTQLEIDHFKLLFSELSSNHKGFLDPPWTFNIREVAFNKNHLLIIDVPRGTMVFRSGEHIYSREEDRNVIEKDQIRIEKLFQNKRGSSESEIIPQLTMADLDLELLNRARSIVERRDTSHKWLSMSDDEMLRASQLFKRDFYSGDEGYTLASALLLGKDSTIQSILTGYKLDIFIRKINTDRWDDRKIIITNLIDTRNIALDFLKYHLPELFYQEGDQRQDLRDLIFREVIGNVIVHREYRNDLPTEIVVEKGMVTSTNPNKVLRKGPLNFCIRCDKLDYSLLNSLPKDIEKWKPAILDKISS